MYQSLQELQKQLRNICHYCSRRAEEGCDPKCTNCNQILQFFEQKEKELSITKKELLTATKELSKPSDIKTYEMNMNDC